MLIIFSGSGTKFVLAWTVKILGQNSKIKIMIQYATILINSFMTEAAII